MTNLAGTGLVLRNNGGDNKSIAANGAFTFATPVVSGGTYAATVFTQPSSPTQTCTVTNGSGPVTAAITNIAVNCVTIQYTVGGTVTGLATGGTVVLQNAVNGGAPGNNLTVSANGSFAFTTALNSNATYAVTRLTNPTVPAGTPAGQTCNVTNGSGTVTSANVTSVTVACVNNDPPTTPPTVTARTPASTAVGSLITGQVIKVTFSETVTNVTGSTFSVNGPTGTVNGTVALVSGNTWGFTPAAPLAYDTAYQVTLTTAIKDGADNPLAANVVWTFNTGKKLALGGEHGCARFDDGRVKCWGHNNYGQLGIENTVNHGDGNGAMGDSTGVTTPPGGLGDGLVPVNLGAGRKVVSLVAGDWHTCAILDNDTVKCWGRNEQGALGLGFISTSVGGALNDMSSVVLPVNFGTGRPVELSLGDELTCLRLDDNSVKCWGANNLGQLGQGNTDRLGDGNGDGDITDPGDTTEIATATAIPLGTGLTAVEISAGGSHVCARLSNSGGAISLKCWGDNTWGQLGLGNTNHRGDIGGEMGDSLPAVSLPTSVTAADVVATSGHTCIRANTTGAVMCWGNNGWGQTGNNLGNQSPVDGAVCEAGRSCQGDQGSEMGDNLPIAIAPGSGVGTLIAGDRQTCVLFSSGVNAGAVKCWGSNEFGQAGLGTNAGANANIGDGAGEMAALVAATLKPSTTVQELSAGGFFECVYQTNGSAKNINCWGDGRFGQMGNGTGSENIGNELNEMGAFLIDLDLGI